MTISCGCCGSPDAKLSPIKHIVNGVEQPYAYCKEHWVNCFHTPWADPPGSDWDSDEPEYIANVERYEAEWDNL